MATIEEGAENGNNTAAFSHQPPSIYKYSFKIDCNTKGWCTPSVSVHSDDPEEAFAQLMTHWELIVNKLKEDGYRVATDYVEKGR